MQVGVLRRLVHEVVGRFANWLGELVEKRFDEAGGCRGADAQGGAGNRHRKLFAIGWQDRDAYEGG